MSSESPLAVSNNNSSLESENVILKPKRRHSRTPKSRRQHQVDEDLKECHLAYEDRIAHHCRYPGMVEPCYETPAVEVNANSTNPIQEVDLVRAVSRQCCRKTCPLKDLEKLCCRTSECLKKCYGSKFTDMDKDASLYRYFDVLIKPHPLRKHRTRISTTTQKSLLN
uniref:Insulin-like domain-containing protein n=1 Tax=Ditylenchus dipsaci TaxID=166011 RepID=A0A915CUE5_9BILA